jgi:hypothetical protein
MMLDNTKALFHLNHDSSWTSTSALLNSLLTKLVAFTLLHFAVIMGVKQSLDSDLGKIHLVPKLNA